MRVIVGACVRNQESTIHVFLNDMQRMRQYFDQYFDLKVVVYENGSTDRTRLVLTSDKSINVIGNDSDTRDIRTERLSRCRNTLWRIATLDRDLDFFVSMDTDYKIPFNIPQIEKSLARCRNFSACFGNTQPFYYDYWALRMERYGYTDDHTFLQFSAPYRFGRTFDTSTFCVQWNRSV